MSKSKSPGGGQGKEKRTDINRIFIFYPTSAAVVKVLCLDCLYRRAANSKRRAAFCAFTGEPVSPVAVCEFWSAAEVAA